MAVRGSFCFWKTERGEAFTQPVSGSVPSVAQANMKSISLLTIALAVLPQGHADSQWTTNGVHKGILTVSAEPGAVTALDSPDLPGGRNFIGQFTLNYSLWTLLDEPVHDFSFSWDWNTSDLVVARRPGRIITTKDLARHPTLSRAFTSLKPLSLSLTTRIDFYGTKGEHLGFGTKNVNPGLVEQAGTREMLHLPGSPRWSDFFTCDFPDHPSRDELTRRNRELFQNAARVVLSAPKITAIEWPDDALQRIAEEFLQLEPPPAPKPVPRPAPQSAPPPKPEVVATNPHPKLATIPNPFEQAARRNSSGVPANPFETADPADRATPEHPLERSAAPLPEKPQSANNAGSNSENPGGTKDLK